MAKVPHRCTNSLAASSSAALLLLSEDILLLIMAIAPLPTMNSENFFQKDDQLNSTTSFGKLFGVFISVSLSIN